MTTIKPPMTGSPPVALTRQPAQPCHARSKSTGVQCRRPAVPGAQVCRFHGGAAPQVRAKAQQRLLLAADSVAGVLVGLATSRKTPAATREAAARAVLDRAGLSPRQVLELTGKDGGPVQSEVIHKLVGARQRLQVYEQQQQQLVGPEASTEPEPPKVETD